MFTGPFEMQITLNDSMSHGSIESYQRQHKDRHPIDVLGSKYPLLKGMMTEGGVMVESEFEWRPRDDGSESNTIHAKDLLYLV